MKLVLHDDKGSMHYATIDRQEISNAISIFDALLKISHLPRPTAGVDYIHNPENPQNSLIKFWYDSEDKKNINSTDFPVRLLFEEDPSKAITDYVEHFKSLKNEV